MDNRKMNTGQAVAAGILDAPAPKSSVPEDFEGLRINEWEWDEGSLRSGLEQGGIMASMYYGCWDVWQTSNGFSGQLLQYCAVTDSFTDESIDFALEKAIEWARGCQG